jgi:hypothetical protein
MVELVKILEERYKKQHDISEISGTHAASFQEYKRDRKKELLSLFKKLGLEDSLDLFKTIEGKKVKAYWFYDEEVELITRLYEDYSGPLVSVRKEQFSDLEDKYAIKLYEDIFSLFTRRGLSSEEAYNRTKTTYNILDYPLRKRQIVIGDLACQFEKITGQIFEERLRNVTSRKDDYEWIEYAGNRIKSTINEMIHLYDVMFQLRQNEINEYAEEKFHSMTKEELEQLEEEDVNALQIYAECENLPRVQELRKKERKITGEPDDKRELLMNWTPRRDYTLKESQALEKIYAEIRELYKKTQVKVQKESIAYRDLQPKLEKKISFESNGLKSSKELLHCALEEIESEKTERGV